MAEGAEAEEVNGWRLSLSLGDAFEECIELRWRPESAGGGKAPKVSKSELEMVLDRGTPDGPAKPSKDSHVKRVPCGEDLQASVSMPEGRRFFIAATAQVAPGKRLRSPWIRAATLKAADRAPGWTAVDPMGRHRQGCKVCPCKGYVPFKWGANSQDRGRCRRCGCECGSHTLGGEALGGGSSSTLSERTAEWLKKNGREQVEPLPPEAVWWSDRECDLWFRTGGLFHPQRTREELRPAQPSQGPAGRGRRRVSVITPTTETRQGFHRSLWACFEAQTWPDKELVVVETYTSSPSAFLKEKAAVDSRLVYAGYQRPEGQDWSIGLKRNMCAQLCTGDILAHFDDDDLYAPEYLSRMVKELQDAGGQGVKLASWFVFDQNTGKWIHCDPLASSAKRGVDETEEWTHKWLYGYGFSYVYLRQAALEYPYQDVSFGEDYAFFTGIQEAKGKSSIALVQDEHGVCLHTQHGRNTSASQHLVLRDLSREEVLDLEVADLYPVFGEYLHRLEIEESLRSPAEPEAQLAKATTRRTRQLRVRTSERDVDLSCPAGATAAELRVLLEEQLGVLPAGSRLFWAPPAGRVPEAVRGELVARALRLVAPCVPLPAGEPDAEQREAAARVEKPIGPQDRVGALTPEIWLVLPAGASGGRCSPWVRVELQGKPSKGSILGVFHVELPPTARVIELREALGQGLPPSARIMAQKPREGLVDLMLHDLVPDKVTISEFTEPILPHMVVTRSMAVELQELMKVLVSKKDFQDKVSQCERQAAGNEKMFNMMVFNVLSEDVFPRLGEHLDLGKVPFFRIFSGALDAHGQDNVPQTLNFLELEMLLRNKTRIAAAMAQVVSMRPLLCQADQDRVDRLLQQLQPQQDDASG